MHRGQVLLTVSAGWVASEIVLALVLRAKKSESRDRLSLHVLWISITGSAVAASFLRTVHVTRIGGGAATFFTGIGLIVAGLVIRWAAILTLRRYFTVDVAIAKDHKIIDTGVYGIVRHPSYAGSLLSFLGLGLAFMNWLSVAIMVIGPAIAFAYRISIEERALVTALGDDYRAYAARTKRLIPGVF